jgi:hypothetical protein
MTGQLSRSSTRLDRHSSLGIFPNDAALLRLAGALLIEQNDEWLIARRYLSQESLELVLADYTTSRDLTPAAGPRADSCVCQRICQSDLYALSRVRRPPSHLKGVPGAC